MVSPGQHKVREGWVEALSTIPETVLDKDFVDLQSFRETTHEWDAVEWQWSGDEANEKG